jgi:hypothetical protein
MYVGTLGWSVSSFSFTSGTGFFQGFVLGAGGSLRTSGFFSAVSAAAVAPSPSIATSFLAIALLLLFGGFFSAFLAAGFVGLFSGAGTAGGSAVCITTGAAAGSGFFHGLTLIRTEKNNHLCVH